MKGAVAGDIIGSPYEWNNTRNEEFKLFDSNRDKRNAGDRIYHARMTDESVLTLAVESWLLSDPELRLSRLASTLSRMGKENPQCGFSPMMERWISTGGERVMKDSGSAAAAMVSPIAIRCESLPEAITTASNVARMLYSNEKAIKGAEAMAEAVWLVRHGRGNDEVKFALENGYGYDLSMHMDDMSFLAQGYIWEPIVINGEETGEQYLRDTGKKAFDAETTVTAAVRAFLDGQDFEDTVRKAVLLGGKSDTIASMAGALAEAWYGVPEEIGTACRQFVPQKLLSVMDAFEQVGEKKGHGTGTPRRILADTFQIIRHGDGQKLFVVDPRRKDMLAAIKARFGEDIRAIRPAELKKTLKELSRQNQEGTYLEEPRPDMRTIHFQEGEFRTTASATGPEMAPRKERLKARSEFYRISDYAQEVKMKLQRSAGYEGEASIHFGSAYYPEIFHERVEIWKGDILAGAVSIDPASGLLSVSKGGDFGPMEWDGERTSPVFTTASPDDIMQAIGSCCLDEGLRTSDIFSKSNLETANEDIARSKDAILLNAVETSQQKSRGMKM